MFTGASVELKTCNAALLEAAGKSWEEVWFLFLDECVSEKIMLCWYHCICYVSSNVSCLRKSLGK